jgi:MoxR-like ATPase
MTTMPDAKPGPNATLSAPIQAAIAEVGRRIVGQETMVERLMVGLLTGGHILLEGVPGLAKTLAVRTLAEIVQASFSRIQFTPDLLPADVVGTMVFDVKTQEFGVKKGPIFANILLADEINRAPAKVQSALLEAMQERQVTIGGHSYRLEEPFMVLATQNPIESEGTYPLPEAQLDRFLLKVHVGYPTRSDEKDILLRMSGGTGIPVEPRLTTAYLLEARRAVLGIALDQRLVDYIVDLVRATRAPGTVGLEELTPLVAFGASPRASIALAQSARAIAFLRGRDFVVPEDIQAMAADVMRHRIVLTFEAEAEDVPADTIIAKILGAVRAP